MKFLKVKNSQSGFTLIELMVVVAIVGILAAIAGPNFAKYQAKSKQAEAKIALAGLYTAEKSFYTEYSAYISSMDAIGYLPEGTKRFYNVGWNANGVSPLGYSGALTTGNFPTANNTGSCGSLAAVGNINVASAQSFTVMAIGCVRNNASTDQWTIDDGKNLQNTSVGL